MPQFHLKASGYEKMKNPDEKVNIEAFCDAKKLYLKGRGYLPIRESNNNRNIIQCYIF